MTINYTLYSTKRSIISLVLGQNSLADSNKRMMIDRLAAVEKRIRAGYRMPYLSSLSTHAKKITEHVRKVRLAICQNCVDFGKSGEHIVRAMSNT